MFFPFDLYKQFEFHLIGISHKTASLEIREQFCVNENSLKYLYAAAKNSGINNLLVIATCNRTELYAFTCEPKKLKKLWLQHTAHASESLFEKHTYHLSNHHAVKHLFEVASGLDAQILGDFEVLGQVKNALKKSRQFQMASGNLTRLAEFAISASKEIKTATHLSSGVSSVASASAAFLQKNVSNLPQKKILLAGAGKIGTTTCDNLIKQIAPENITVVNRTYEKALQTAKKYGLKADNYERLETLIQEHDIVIVATGAANPVITKKTFRHINAAEKMLLDLSVPRNIDAAVNTLSNITIVNIDQLEDIKNESLEQRQLSIPKAKQIIHRYILEYYAWLHTTPVFPVIEKLSAQMQYADLHHLHSELEEAGMIVGHERTANPKKILNRCIRHLKENYHKPEAENIIRKILEAV